MKTADAAASRTVPLDDIEASRSPYDVGSTRGVPLDALTASIREHGVLTPLWAERDSGGFVLVHGFRRLAAARAAGLREAPLAVLTTGSRLDRFRRALSDNRATRPVSLREKVAALRVLESFGSPDEDLVRRDLPLLGLPAQAKTLRALRRLRELPAPLLSILSDKECPQKRWASFLDLDDTGKKFLSDVAALLRPGLNDLETLARCLLETARREERPPAAILDEQGAHEFIAEARSPGDGNAPQRLARLLAAFVARRYPELSARRESLHALAKEAKPPPFAKLRWDETLEERGVTVEMRLAEAADLEEAARWLSDDSRRIALRRLLDETD